MKEILIHSAAVLIAFTVVLTIVLGYQHIKFKFKLWKLKRKTLKEMNEFDKKLRRRRELESQREQEADEQRRINAIGY